MFDLLRKKVAITCTGGPVLRRCLQASAPLSLRVLVRALNPHERLRVYHVARSKVVLVAAYRFGELKQARVCLPRRLRLVPEIETVLARRDARDSRLEKDVRLRLRNETEDGHERPSQHARLLSGKRCD